MNRVEEFASTLEKDGFVVVPSFLDEKLVDQARRDLEAIYGLDLEERKLRNADYPDFTHGSTRTVLTPPSHLALRLPGRSTALDACYEKILTDPMSSELLRRTVGKNFKLRDVNCRYMTGSVDDGNFLNPPHEWHRDSPGEFTIALFLNEVSPGDNAGTAVVPGSHKYPWCPRWNALFGAPFYISRKGGRGPDTAPRFNIFSRLLHHFFVKRQNAHGIFGKPGDFYIFLNDTWHGRVPNLHAERAMIVMAGGFPTDFPFPDEPAPFDSDMVNSLPPTYRRVAARDLPANTEKNSIIHRLAAERLRERPTDLFWWSRKERELMVAFFTVTQKVNVFFTQKMNVFFAPVRNLVVFARRVIAKIGRTLVAGVSTLKSLAINPVPTLKSLAINILRPIYRTLISIPALRIPLQTMKQRLRTVLGG
jgi:hypothetical protein